MNTRKSEWRTVVRWIALVIQVLIVLKGGQTTSSSLVSLSVSPSLLTSSSAVQASTKQATAAPPSSLPGQTTATATTPLSSSSLTVLSSSAVQATTKEATATPSSSLPGQTTATATTPLSSSSLTVLSSSGVQATTKESAATPLPSSPLPSQTAEAATTPLSSYSPTVLSSSGVQGTTKESAATPLPSSPLPSQTAEAATTSLSSYSPTVLSSSAVQATTKEEAATPSSSLAGQAPATATTPLSSSSPTVQSSVPPSDKVPMSPSPSKSVSSTASSTASPSSSPNVENATVTPSLYVQMSLSMPWGRFCYLTTLFKEALSRDLIEFKGLHYHHVPLDRIKFYDVDKKCKNRTLYHSKKAIVKLFISKTERFVSKNDTDEKMTIKAFKLLYYCWVNKRMILLDKTFEGKVRKVELINGTDNKDITSEYVDKYTEAQRIGIAIGIALLIVLLILIIVFCLKGRRAIRNFGRKPEDDKMVFTNAHALEESPMDEPRCASQPLESHAQPRDEPEEVVVHTQPSPLPIKESEPVSTAQDETPLLSAIKDYEDGKKADETKTDKEPGEEEAPLAKPEYEEISEEEPSKPPRSDSLIVVDTATTEENPPTSETPVTEEPAKTEDEPAKTEDEPAKTEEEPAKTEDEPAKTEDEPEEEGSRERRPTFTSSVTINITPEPSTSSKGFNYPVTVQLPEPEKDENQQGPAAADEVSGKEDEKPDFGQSDSSDADPNQGAINLGFDIEDEASKEETEEEEETKF